MTDISELTVKIKSVSMMKVVVDTVEVASKKAISEKALTEANELVVKDDESYANAIQAIRGIKVISNNIIAYFKPIKDEANTIHKTICGYESDASSPLTKAESVIKVKMASYQSEQRKAAQEAAEAAARIRQREADALLEKAVTAEQSGDSLSAAIMQDMAVQAEAMTVLPVVSSAYQIKGVSTRKTWKAKIVDEKLVPVEIAGMIIRPVDMKALNSLASTSKGKISVPGVEFYQDENITVGG